MQQLVEQKEYEYGGIWGLPIILYLVDLLVAETGTLIDYAFLVDTAHFPYNLVYTIERNCCSRPSSRLNVPQSLPPLLYTLVITC